MGRFFAGGFRRIRQSGPHACRSFSVEAGVVRFIFQSRKPMMNYSTSRGVAHPSIVGNDARSEKRLQPTPGGTAFPGHVLKLSTK
jgi:hypothetical protein